MLLGDDSRALTYGRHRFWRGFAVGCIFASAVITLVVRLAV